MLQIYAILILVGAFVNTIFSLFVYSRDKKALPNRTYGLMSLSVAIWGSAWFLMLIASRNYYLAKFLAKLLTFGATFIPLFYFHWILSILNIHKRFISIFFVNCLSLQINKTRNNL